MQVSLCVVTERLTEVLKGHESSALSCRVSGSGTMHQDLHWTFSLQEIHSRQFEEDHSKALLYEVRMSSSKHSQLSKLQSPLTRTVVESTVQLVLYCPISEAHGDFSG